MFRSNFGWAYFYHLAPEGGLLAGEEGLEPSFTDPESAVLPLDDSPAQVELYPLRGDVSKLLA